MQEWEYLSATFRVNDKGQTSIERINEQPADVDKTGVKPTASLTETMTVLGSKGWELVNSMMLRGMLSSDRLLIFKRPKL
jgi:hypothetical protein